ncbi:alcohol dehydrogenase [Methanocella sp. CWC-04]|uniref:Alcohol dehydrogenase n=1 Tax=Methanooceanicella nereidis TaxID=2052831 RepID=A0AAP2RCC4_9EURY|nr:alcohol dehydrogenase-like regulatory protein ErcA [Methanocella sp. CWC-04]MCD1294005.1 alcohol dehydrogenase [Methanocella sp. CWC-04]
MALKNVPELRKFVAPEIVYGEGAIDLAGRYAKIFGASKVMLVTGKKVLKAGWSDIAANSIEKAGLEYTVFSDVTPNPRVEEVMKGAGVYREEGCDIILAVGGGSVIDCAKGIGIVSTNRKSILDFEGADRVHIPGPPLICIPTTAGSSADVSQFAIISDRNNLRKIAIISKTLVPDIALIDPVTTITMEADLTASTGIDALTHAIEAYVSNAHSPLTDVHALEAVSLICSNLLHAIEEPENIVARSGMMLGSLHAGLAFSNASLGAVHAMAHSLGGLSDLSHGECNSILLSHVIKYNYQSAPWRFDRIAIAMGLQLAGSGSDERSSALSDHVREILRKAGIDKCLGDLGVKNEDIRGLVQNALRDPCIVTNPRIPSESDLERIYEEAL